MATKIVRDNIREVDGFVPCNSDNWRNVRNNGEHTALLMQKVLEEFGELILANEVGYSSDINEEGCDLIEVIQDLLALRTGITPEQIQRRIASKRSAKGGFLGGLVWEHP